VDINARLLASKLTELLGQQVVVENKPGAGTNIANEFVARSAPDGYTLYLSNFASHAVNRHFFAKMPFDPVKDFTHVAMMVKTVLFLCVKPGSPFKTAGEIAAYGKANPGKLTYGSTGNGSPNHISGENLKHLGKFDAVHVPYKGAAELNADLLAGQLDYAFDASVIQMHRTGKIKCIGVTTAKTWGTDPDLPPIADTVPGFDLLSFFGIVGPAKMPEDIVQKLNDAFVQVAKKPEMVSRLAVSGGIPYAASLKEAREFLTDVDQRWGPLVKATGAKVD
jgi:tripartite-type tricarboxylate transporter receptor subunit TctC